MLESLKERLGDMLEPLMYRVRQIWRWRKPTIFVVLILLLLTILLYSFFSISWLYALLGLVGIAVLIVLRSNEMIGALIASALIMSLGDTILRFVSIWYTGEKVHELFQLANEVGFISLSLSLFFFFFILSFTTESIKLFRITSTSKVNMRE